MSSVYQLLARGARRLSLALEPHLEGVNAHATAFQMYFQDPFLAYIYLAFVPFFVGLYQALKLLKYVGQDKAFSLPAVKALRTIKRCACITACFFIGAEAFIFIVQRNRSDDIAGGVAMELLSQAARGAPTADP